MKHFRCACGAVNEITTMMHPSQNYCGLCKTMPIEVFEGQKTMEFPILENPPVESKSILRRKALQHETLNHPKAK
jgi:hypothetical protein